MHFVRLRLISTLDALSSCERQLEARFSVVQHFFELPSAANLAKLEQDGRRHCALD